ncbi:MAG: PaaI family thioesterase [Thermoplasmata archaeon]|nr:PaaI family thioesterase [Thermoplasmata archaeon]
MARRAREGRSPAAGPSTSPSGRLAEIRAALAAGWVAPVAALVGFRLERIDPGRSRIVLDADGRHANPMGTLHGGILCDIADAAMGMAYASRLRSEESFTTIELKINFLRPFWTGRLTAEGRILRKGRSLGLVECRIHDDERHFVAYATATCLTLPAGSSGSMARSPTDPRSLDPSPGTAARAAPRRRRPRG